jgi:Iap family predicted aminopeptidase
MIFFDEDTAQETIEKNAENLKIAELNLLDFNKRMEKDYDLICKFTNEKPRFFLKQELRYPDNTNTIASQINWLLMWKKEKKDKAYFKIFFSDIQKDFEEITRYHSPYVQKDTLYYKKVENFKKKYTDYAPLGFLDEDDEGYIKREIHEKFLRHLESL